MSFSRRREREKERKRGAFQDKPRVYAIESRNLVRLTSFPGLLLCSWTIDTRALARSRAHARFTTVFSPPLFANGELTVVPFQYSRRHSDSTCYRDTYVCTYTRRRRLDLQRAFGTSADSPVLLLVLGRRGLAKQYCFMWNNNDNSMSWYGRIIRSGRRGWI